MEAVPRLHFLWFALKTSPDGTSYANLKKFIAEYYQEDPESYSKEVYSLETLRNTAMRPEKNMDGCRILKRYYCQLHSISNRFPMISERNIFTFSWKDLYANGVTEINDIRYEMAAVLFNIGAIHTQVGASVSRNDVDGMKLACTHFQCAAWAFGELKDKYQGITADFMTPELLIFMQQISFGQAQECILEKSLIDNRKPGIVAKVTAQIVQYYGQALMALLSGGDDGSISQVIDSNVFKMWKKYVRFKISYLSCILYLYQGQQSEEQQKMGERVALYQAACDKLEEARKESKGLPDQKEIIESLTFTADVVEGKRKNAKNENEFIYHEAVPELSEIAATQGANLVNGTCFSLTDPDIAGDDIFGRLVPMKAHEASSLYSEEKAKIVREIGNKIEIKDNDLSLFMSSLNVDGLNVSEERANKIPQGIVDRCAALNAKTNAIPDLISSMSNLAECCIDVEMNLKEIKEILSEEELKEQKYQQNSGVHRSNAHLTELTREFQKYLEAHQKAGDSNDTLRRAMELHVNNLKILARPLQEIKSSIPKLTGQVNQEQFDELKLLLNKVNEMKAQRAQFHADLRIAINDDDITNKVIAAGPDADLRELFKKETTKHDKIIKLVDQNLLAQENILKALTDAYARCAQNLKIMTDVKHKKETFFSSLAASYDVYEDLLAKSAKGLEFYKKLQGNIQRLLTRVKSARDVQSEDRQQRIRSSATAKSIVISQANNFPQTTLTTSQTSVPKLKDYLNKKNPSLINKDIIPTDSLNTPQYIPSIRPNPLGSENPTAAATCLNSSNGSGLSQAPVFPTPSSDPPPPYIPPTGYLNPIYQNAEAYADSSHYQTPPPIYQQQYNPHSAKIPIPTDQQPNQISPPPHYTRVDQFPQKKGGYQVDNISTPNMYSTNFSLTSVYGSAIPSSFVSPNIDKFHSPQQQFSGYTQMSSVELQPQQQTSYVTNQMDNLNLQQNMNSNYNSQYIQAIQNLTTPTFQSNNQTYLLGQQSGQQNYATNYQPEPNSSFVKGQINNTTINQENQPTAISKSNMNQGQTAVPNTSNYLPTSSNLNFAQQTNLSSYYNVPNASGFGGSQVQMTSQPKSQNFPNVTQQIHSNSAQKLEPIYSQIPSTSSTQKVQINTSNLDNNYDKNKIQFQNNPQYDNEYALMQKTANQHNTVINQNPEILDSSTKNILMPTSSSLQNLENKGTSSELQNTSSNNKTPIISNYSGYHAGPFSYQSYNEIDHVTSHVKLCSAVQVPQASTSYFYQIQNPSMIYMQSNTNSNTNTTTSNDFTQPAALPYQNPTSIQCNQQLPSTQFNQQFMSVQANQQCSSVQSNQQVLSEISQQMPQPNHQIQQNQPTQKIEQDNQMLNQQTTNQHQIESKQPVQQINESKNPTGKSLHEPKQAKKRVSNVDLLTNIELDASNIITPLLQPIPAHKKITNDFISNGILMKPEKESVIEVNILEGDIFPEAPALPTNSGHERKLSLDQLSISSDLSSLDHNSIDWDTVSIRSCEYKTFVPDDKINTFFNNNQKNPFDDPKTLKYFHKEVERYEKGLDTINVKMLNGNTSLINKWKELQDLLVKDELKRSTTVGKLFPEKNRTQDCIPYDHARVILERSTDNYINAAYVKDLGPGCPVFIIAQTPLQNTLNDFWAMLWSHKTRVVICLHTPNEILDTFWPEKLNQEMQFDDFSVTLVKQFDLSHCTELNLKLTMSGADAVLDLSLLQLKTWTKNCASQAVGIAQNILVAYKQRCQEFKTTSPIVMNCLTGSERSGIIALAICAILAMQSKRPTLINVVDVWYRICSQRKSALRDQTNLEFSMQIVLSNGHDILNKRGIMTSYQMKKAQDVKAIEKEEVNDPLNDLDPLWKLKNK